MWVIFVFCSDRRKPIGASTAAASSRMHSACSRVPATRISQSSAYRMRRQLGCPCCRRIARCHGVDCGPPGCWARCPSSTDRATLASTGERIPPCGVPVSFVVAAHVRTVSTVLRRPRPAMRTHTFASRFDTSIPAQRPWMTSMINSLRSSNEQPFDAGRAKAIRKSDARAQGDNPRFSW